MNYQKMSYIFYFVIISSFIAFVSIAYAANWTAYATTEQYTFFYDKNSLQKIDSDIVEVYVKIVYSTESGMREAISLKYNKPIVTEVKRCAIDCKGRELKNLSNIFYASNGEVLDSWENSDKFHSIVPDSVTDQLYNKLCQSGAPHG